MKRNESKKKLASGKGRRIKMMVLSPRVVVKKTQKMNYFVCAKQISIMVMIQMT